VHKPYGWDEVGLRAHLYHQLAPLLRAAPLDTPAVLRTLMSDKDVLSGHQVVKTRVKQFCQHERAAPRVEALVGSAPGGGEPPAPVAIEAFVDGATVAGFHAPNGTPDKSGALLLASVLLTAAYPDRFVDYRLGRWQSFSECFDLPTDTKTTDGDLLYWAGEVARDFASTRTFREHLMPAAERHFQVWEPNWVVAGLAFLLRPEAKLPLYPMLRDARAAFATSARNTRPPKVKAPKKEAPPQTPSDRLAAVLAKLRKMQRKAP
jgi:hypothetical protein